MHEDTNGQWGCVCQLLGHGWLSSPEGMIAMAQGIAEAPWDEWLVGLFLNPAQQIIGATRIEHTHHGQIHADATAVFEAAAAIKAASVVTVRYHPHEGIFNRRRATERVDALLEASDAAGIPLHNHIICYRDGFRFSWRDHAGRPAYQPSSAEPVVKCDRNTQSHREYIE